MWPFDGWFGAGLNGSGSVGSGGSLTIDPGEGVAPTTYTADPGNYPASQYAASANPNAAQNAQNIFGGLGSIGSKLSAQANAQPQATPASNPLGGGGPSPIAGLLNMLAAGAPMPIPGTGQAPPYVGPQAPLGPASQSPILAMLLKARLGQG